MKPNKKPQPKPAPPIIPLMELLAINRTKTARELLKHYTGQDATSYDDLENKLQHLYETTKQKGGKAFVDLQKDLAEIHPHSNFILKYLCPPPVVTKTTVKIPEKQAPADGESQSNCGGEEVSEDMLNDKETVIVEQPIIKATIIEEINKHEQEHHGHHHKHPRITTTEIVGVVALVGILTIGFAFIHYTNKKYK